MHTSLTAFLIGSAPAVAMTAAAAPVKVEKTKYGIYGNCYRLSNGAVEVLVTTDIGPRVIAYRFIGQENILAELGPDSVVNSDLGAWRPWGGHRLWHAPEAMPRSYSPDDKPVKAELTAESAVRLTQDVEPATGIQKEMIIALDPDSSRVTIIHTLTNRGIWPVELAPWALTIVRGGGTTIFPQEPFVSHDDRLLPARPMVLWNFTDMADPRWAFGTKFVRLRTAASIQKKPQKIGAGNKLGWAAYLRNMTLFVKRFPYIEGATYPDCGCNFETYTDGDFMEVETLGPLTTLQPNGSTTHVERWYLFDNVKTGDTEDSLAKAVDPLLRSTD